MRANGLALPIYWGNRNWQPMLPDTMQKMVDDGVQNAIAFVVSGYSSYSGCRQYRENLLASQATFGDRAPQFGKIRVFYNHPDFIAANADRMLAALQQIPMEARSKVHVAFTAHSIPESMASGCNYVVQLQETCRLIAEAVGSRCGTLEAGLPKSFWTPARPVARTGHLRPCEATQHRGSS